jgi:hypothetical protein
LAVVRRGLDYDVDFRVMRWLRNGRIENLDWQPAKRKGGAWELKIGLALAIKQKRALRVFAMEHQGFFVGRVAHILEHAGWSTVGPKNLWLESVIIPWDSNTAIARPLGAVHSP